VQSPVPLLRDCPCQNVRRLKVLNIPLLPRHRNLKELSVASVESSVCTVLINYLEESTPGDVVETEIYIIAELLAQGRRLADLENVRTNSSLTLSELIPDPRTIVVAALYGVVWLEP
jgi:hypothetical protein